MFLADFIILALPVPQLLELLNFSDLEIPEDIHSELVKVKYERCIALLVKGHLKKKYSDAVFIEPKEGPITLIINNHIKGVSDYSGALAVHTNPKFSLKNWNVPNTGLMKLIHNEFTQYVHNSYEILRIHRWRYSRAIYSHPQPYLVVHDPGLMAFGGDSFTGVDIEGAALSGLGVAKAIISKLGWNK
jgi:predicted NAD/FAD-dependent oxidoreductase